MSELQINTAQNVKIQFRTASVISRIVAFGIDGLIKIAYLYAIGHFLSGFNIIDQWSQIGAYTLLSLPIVFYSLVLESLLNGQTLGKKLTRIKVVKIEGYQASFSDYVVRWFFRIVDIYVFGLGLFVVIFSSRNQRIGDMAAGTAVLSLKDKASISQTILEELSFDYIPTYPSVIKLSDNDARIIKDSFEAARDSRNHKMLIKLRIKIMEVIGEDNTSGTDIQFIETILKDYNFYTQDM